jgi:hypothetical protein
MALERQITGDPKALLEEEATPEPPRPEPEPRTFTGFNVRRKIGRAIGLTT